MVDATRVQELIAEALDENGKMPKTQGQASEIPRPTSPLGAVPKLEDLEKFVRDIDERLRVFEGRLLSVEALASTSITQAEQNECVDLPRMIGASNDNDETNLLQHANRFSTAPAPSQLSSVPPPRGCPNFISASTNSTKGRMLTQTSFAVLQRKVTQMQGDFSVKKIRGPFVNFQHRAYDALDQADKYGDGTVAKALRCTYVVSLAFLVLSICVFICWGLYKIAKTTAYAEIHHENRDWVGGSLPLPTVAYELLSAGFSLRISHCSIEFGNYSTKRCVFRDAQACQIAQSGSGSRSLMSCLPPNLDVLGTYGDPLYKYVVLDVFPNRTLGHASGDLGYLSVAYGHHLTMSKKVMIRHLYTFSDEHPVANEMFFRKVISIVGEPFGFAGRQGNDESEGLLRHEIDMVKISEYNRPLPQDAWHSQVMSLYLRADLLQQEDFYEPYSVLRLLESCGGLWTSLVSTLSISIWVLAWAYTSYVKRCRRSNEKENGAL